MQKQVVEIYRKPKVQIGLLDEIVENSKVVSDTQNLYAELGFEKLSKRGNGPIVYPQIYEEDWKIWKEFLPTAYYYNKDEWKDFSFDDIPLEVLREIKHVQSLRVFDNLAIRTPEKQLVDPLVCGIRHRGHDHFDAYMIARWGESLLSFADVCRQVFFTNARFLFESHVQIPRSVKKEILEKHLFSFWMEKMVKKEGVARLDFSIRRLSLKRHCSAMMADFSSFWCNDFTGYLCLRCGEIRL